MQAPTGSAQEPQQPHWTVLRAPSFPLGTTKERGGPLPLILSRPSSLPRIPFSLPYSGFNNTLWG